MEHESRRHRSNRTLLITFLVLHCLFHVYDCFTINSTGGSFPVNVYAEATFAYQFTSSDFISYFGGGSGVGKCNIMGYWNIGNLPSQSLSPSQQVVDTLICTDACTLSNACGMINTSPRFGSSTRTPLVDFAGTDSKLSAADYASFPDLQLLPAIAGAAVPVYNVPIIPSNLTLVLSRQTIVNIFTGKIQLWNDSSILADNIVNAPAVYKVLRYYGQPINVVVRTDSSGTSEIFSTALWFFDPPANGPFSFATQVGKGSTPAWCGTVTDEVHVMTITGCPSTGNKVVQLKMIVGNGTVPYTMQFNCDSTAIAITNAFGAVGGPNTTVIVNQLGNSQYGSTNYSIGYSDRRTIGKNWYRPIVMSTPTGVRVTVTTLQEGGYLNSHYNATYSITPLIQSLWVRPIGVSMLFKISWMANGVSYSTPNLDANNAKDLTNVIYQGLVTAGGGAVSTSGSPGSVVVRHNHGAWDEYQITFLVTSGSISSTNGGSGNTIPTVYTSFTTSCPTNIDNVAIFALLDYNNYPLFYDSRHPIGSSGSGRYTCYMRSLGYKPWSYWTGKTNPGVIANVFTKINSIGYSVLTDALASYLPMADLINKAGAVIAPSSYSVASAVMDKGSNLNANFEAVLADSSSVNSWPMAGLSYFVIRRYHHVGSCARRIASMTYLYKYYHSATVNQIAVRLGFATLPDYIRDLVLQKLINSAFCSNGQYALSAYRTFPTPLLSSSSFTATLKSYLSVYNAIDAQLTWSVQTYEDSSLVWNNFDTHPALYGAAFTLFSSAQERYDKYIDPYVFSYAFANVAVVPLYHLDAFTALSSAPLKITAQILVGIYTGTIVYWDDPLLVTANYPNGQYLPHKVIVVVGRVGSTDANAIFLRYLALKSATFAQQYAAFAGGDKYFRTFDFAQLQQTNRLITATNNLFVDSNVLALDGAFGYYLQTTQPSSNVAWFCSDSSCIAQPVNPADNGRSIATCQNDVRTIVNPSSLLYSYDLMVSASLGCYPIVGTVDMNIYWYNDPNTCAILDATGESIVGSKLKLGTFLFNGTAIVNPLQTISAAPAANIVRETMYNSLCGLTCGNNVLGYNYCNYRDCTWNSGDFLQVVSECNPKTQKRTVTYVRVTNTNSTCYPNAATLPPSPVLIDCAYVYPGSSVASAAVAMCVIGVSIDAFIVYLTSHFSQEKVFRRSQLVFVYIFLCGAVLMNLTILAFYGPNSNAMCMLRVWAFNLSSTIMFAPLIMKLNRVERFFYNVRKGIRRKNIPDRVVLMQVFGLVSVDILICLIWSSIATATPRQLWVNVAYGNVQAVVSNPTCSTSINQTFEIAIVAWKALQLVYGIIKAIRTWDMPEDVSEAKYFAVAIYNIGVIGSFCYFLSVFGNATVETVVILRCIGIFFSATIASLVIMGPKFVAIQLNWTEFLLGVKSSYEDDFSSAPDGSHVLDQNPNHMYGEAGAGAVARQSGRGGMSVDRVNAPGMGTVGGGGLAIPSNRERASNRIGHGPTDQPIIIPLGPGGLPRLDVELEMANNRPQANAAVPLLKLNVSNPSPVNGNGGTTTGSSHGAGGISGHGVGGDPATKLYIPLPGEEGGVEKPAGGGGGNYSPPRGGTFNGGSGKNPVFGEGGGGGGDYSPPMSPMAHHHNTATVEGPIHPAYAR